jgi:hypothetical protein
MKAAFSIGLVMFSLASVARADEWSVLFDGKSLDGWEYGEGAWAVNDDGVLYCNMETVAAKNGQSRTRGMGYIWTRQAYDDFELSFSYKLSEGANSGVFFRTDKDNPVQGGFEIQLMDDDGFQQSHGEKNPKNLNGAFYDAQAASSNPAKPAGQWNQMTLKCQGPRIQVSINGVVVNEVDVDRWDTPNKNPDGTPNKFKTALKELPRTGRIGFQNHGQVIWIKDVKVRTL